MAHDQLSDQQNTAPGTAHNEEALVAALQRGDEAAFITLVERYHQSLQRVALSYVGSWSLAEEVVQETWIGVIRGVAKFEGRSSLKTWIYRILANCAQRRGAREARIIPFADLAGSGAGPDEPSVDPSAFVAAEHPEAGWWASYPTNWAAVPEARMLADETRAVIDAAINELPATQRIVITLRDVEGWGTEEVTQLLAISAVNQRVLLHRARSRVRRSLERYFAEG